MNALAVIAERWSVPTSAARYPIEIPDTDRESLADLFGVLGYGVGAEIGVEQGVYSEVLLRSAPDLILFCIDAWKAYDGYRDHRTQSKLDGFMAATQERLEPYQSRYRLYRDFSVDAARQFENGSLDFVYIDANHSLQHVIQDLEAWVPKVRSGGIVAGHDFSQRVRNGYQCHVVEAVRAWTSAYHVVPWFVLGRKEVREGERRDRPRSFFWVVP